MSANAPILQKILDRLDSIDSRLTKVETRLTNVETRLTNVETRLTNVEIRLTNVETRLNVVEHEVVKLRSYVQNESYIQERKFTSFLKKYLLQRFKSGVAQVIPFGQFFIPYDNNPLTDIDGCVILHVPPMHFKRNGENVTIDASRTFFIEAKHAITKTILDKKLRQFVKIMESIGIVQDNAYVPGKKESEFDKMIRTHGVHKFPRNIVFLLSTDKLAPDALEIILAITTGTFTKEQYNSLLLQYILTHPLIKDIAADDNVHEYVRKRIQTAKSIDDIAKLLNPIRPATASKSQYELYKKCMTLAPYKESIQSLLVPFESYAALLEPLRGKMGFISEDSIQLPEGIARDGFHSRNALMNMVYNIPYNFVEN